MHPIYGTHTYLKSRLKVTKKIGNDRFQPDILLHGLFQLILSNTAGSLVRSLKRKAPFEFHKFAHSLRFRVIVCIGICTQFLDV